MRVFMCKGAMLRGELAAVEMPHRAGGTYIVPDHIGQGWIEDQLAYEDGAPPSCPECGEEFEGNKAYHNYTMHLRFTVPRCTVRNLTVAELRERAKGAGVQGASGMKKAELVEAVSRAEG